MTPGVVGLRVGGRAIHKVRGTEGAGMGLITGPRELSGCWKSFSPCGPRLEEPQHPAEG